MSERTVVLRNSKGFFLTAQLYTNQQITQTTRVPDSWEIFTLVDFGTAAPAPNQNPNLRLWGLRAANGKWVRTDGEATLYADATAPLLTTEANNTVLGAVQLTPATTTLGTPALPWYGLFNWVSAYGVNNFGVFSEVQVIDWPDVRRKPDQKVGLQAPNGCWLSADSAGQSPLVARPPWREVWETFTLRDLGNNQIALIACNGQFVSADPGGGGLIANRPYIGPSETFTVTYLPGGQLNLLAGNGRYVTAEGGGGGGVTNNRTVAAEWETFNLYIAAPAAAPDRPIALQTFDGLHYVKADNAGASALVANATSVGTWEIFTLKDLGNSRAALVACNGKYVRADESGQALIADQAAIGPMTIFDIKALGQNRYALRTAKGKYVGATGGGGFNVYNDRAVNDIWEAFTFVPPFAPPSGNTISLQADNGQYLVRYSTGGPEEIRAASWSIGFTVSQQGYKVAIKADNGKWWSRIDRGSYQSIEAAKTQIDQFCLFTVSQMGNVIALQADNGKYVSRVNHGSFDRLEAAKSQLDSYCLFVFSKWPS